MSHQDKKSQRQVVINHQVLRDVVNWLLPPTVFVGMRTRKGSRWKPRMLAAAAALFWATSDRPTLAARFDHARKVIRKVFHWQSAPGKSYEGFIKMLRRRNRQLLAAVVGVLRARMREELKEQFRVAGFTVFAGDGSRVATPRTKSNQAAFSPRRKQKKKSKKKMKRNKSQAAGKRRKQKRQSAASTEKKSDMTQIWLTLLCRAGQCLNLTKAV